MLDRQTVLILGAGASAPYGLPLGVGLRDALLANDGEFTRRLQERGVGPDRWAAVQERLWCFQSPSVVEFLARYPEDSDLTKLAIAHELNKFENVRDHLSPHKADSWYRTLLFDILNDDKQLGGGLLKIITFNYDLSLEVYLFETLKSRHRISDDEARAALANLEITHIHGHLGPVASIHGNGRRYGPYERLRSLAVAAQNISTCFEPESQEAVERARRLIRGSAAVLFLGFGYGVENLARLDLKNTLHEPARVGGSVWNRGWWMDRLKPHVEATGFYAASEPGKSETPSVRLVQNLFDFATQDHVLYSYAIEPAQRTKRAGKAAYAVT